MDFTQLLIIFILFSVSITYFFKKKFKAETYFLISLWRTSKFNSFFEKHKNYLFYLVSKIGLIFGFGLLAIDYLFLQKYSKKLRLSFLLILSLVLSYFLSPSIAPYITLYSDYSFLITFFLISTGLAGFIFAALFVNAIDIIFSYLAGSSACPGLAPVIPGVEIPKVNFTPPLHAWISLIIILAIHEGFHGFLARYFKIPLKSAGIVLLGLLPIGAFVEPDEKKLKTNKNSVYVYSAGPSSNLLLTLLTALLILFLSFSFLSFYGQTLEKVQTESSLGVYVQQVDENFNLCGKIYPSPAYNILQPDDKILKINSYDANHLQDFYTYNTSKDINLTVLRNEEILEFQLEKNSLNRLGIYIEERKDPSYIYPENYLLYTQSFSLILDFLYWLALLSFLVAVANFLPLVPFDGGHILPVLLTPLLGKHNYTKIILLILIPILFINILPLFL